MTFVSRLDAVKRAAEFQIRQILNESPNVKVGLITFGSEVGTAICFLWLRSGYGFVSIEIDNHVFFGIFIAKLLIFLF